jgi:hypothetical protein
LSTVYTQLAVLRYLPTLVATSWNSDRLWHASLMLPLVSRVLPPGPGTTVSASGATLWVYFW